MELLSQFWERALEPKDRRSIYEWLGNYWDMQTSAYTKTGLFRVDDSRHLIALFDSYQNERKRETNVCAPTRGGKTLWMDGCHLWSIKIRPGSTLVLFQEEKAVADQSENRTWPNINHCAPVSAMLSRKAQQNRLTEIIFPHMYFHIRGPSDSNLQSRGYQNVWVDEPWLLKEGKIEEARARLGDFVKMGTDKFQCLSQGGPVGSEWDRQFKRGVVHEWHVQCLSCGHYMIPCWTGSRADGSMWGMRWDTHKDASGLWDISKAAPTIRFECEACAHPHIWGTRVRNEWNRTGKYIAESDSNKLPTRDSFHWTAVIDTPWDYLVDLYLQARNAWKIGTSEPLVKFFQKRMAEMSSEGRLLENKLNFAKARYEIQSKPENAVRILSADRQDEDVYWVMVRDWYPTTEEKRAHTKRVWYGKCHSAGEIEQKRIELGIEPRRVLIDSGFKPKGDHGVYAYCIRYGWIPVKGVATDQGDPVAFKHSFDDDDGNPVAPERSYSEPVTVDAEIGRGKEDLCQMIKFSSPTFADRVDALIERGLWIEPEPDASNISPEMERELHIQMTAEYSRAITVGNKQTRRTKKVRVCPSGNNHGYDCAKIQVLGATVLEILPDLEVEQDTIER